MRRPQLTPPALFCTALMTISGCADGTDSPPAGSTGPGGAGASVTSTGGTTTSSTAGAGGEGGRPPLPRVCEVDSQGIDATPYCEVDPRPPIDGFNLVEKWHYDIEPGAYFVEQPLLANLTDDNADGRINLCDTPDLLVQGYFSPLLPHPPPTEVRLILLSGNDGTATVLNPGNLSFAVPAIGDLDADGTPEIVTTNDAGHAVAVSPTGSILWESDAVIFDAYGWYGVKPDPTPEQRLRARFVTLTAAAIHDLEGDGSPEILIGTTVLNADGSLRFQDPENGSEFGFADYIPIRPTVADLDGDGTLEVLFGHVTYDANGVELWRVGTTIALAHPADFDGDGAPEVLLASEEGLTLVSAEGSVLWGPVRPPNDSVPPRLTCWSHPVAIADMTGDGIPEAVANTCEARMVLSITTTGPVILRSEPVPITSSFSAPQIGSSAFDFVGGSYDWLSGDHQQLTHFTGLGPEWRSQEPGRFTTGLVFPLVADVDNDGSADVVAMRAHNLVSHGQRIVVYEDAQRRPSPARRIWNQWNYWASNVREDAIIPRQPSMPWNSHNTYRVQTRLGCRTDVPPR